MHLTTRPVARIELDAEAHDFNVVTASTLVASTTNPYDAIRAVINLELKRDAELLAQEELQWLELLGK